MKILKILSIKIKICATLKNGYKRENRPNKEREKSLQISENKNLKNFDT